MSLEYRYYLACIFNKYSYRLKYKIIIKKMKKIFVLISQKNRIFYWGIQIFSSGAKTKSENYYSHRPISEITKVLDSLLNSKVFPMSW